MLYNPAQFNVVQKYYLQMKIIGHTCRLLATLCDWHTQVSDNISPLTYVLYTVISEVKQYLKFNNIDNNSNITPTIEYATMLEIKQNNCKEQYVLYQNT